MSDVILTLNAGSSSLKFALFSTDALSCLSTGQIEGLGTSPRLTVSFAPGFQESQKVCDKATVSSHAAALREILSNLFTDQQETNVVAVGHRIVHGGTKLAGPVTVDDDVLRYLQRLEPLAPLHQPHNISGIKAAKSSFPDALQVACPDTAFHRGLPWESETFALPPNWYEEGVRRYGFHGLSYEYVAGELARMSPHAAQGRVVIAHLGNGASMCALKAGRPIATTMGFSALDGLPMGTRCGQIDPGVLLYMMSERQMSTEEVEDLLYRQSGLKGLSGVSHDVREIETANTPEATKAIEFFCYRIRRELGSLAAALGGLDALVFCGGIGENSAHVRAQACKATGWLGIEVDAQRNAMGDGLISSDASRVAVYVIATNEEIMIARHTRKQMNATPN